MRRSAIPLKERAEMGPVATSLADSELLGKTITVEITIQRKTRTLRGIIVKAEQSENDALHVALDDPDGSGGSPVLIVPHPALQPDERFGAEYFLRLSDDLD